MKSVFLSELIDKLGIEVVHASDDIEKIELSLSETNRPGLQLAGYYEKFSPARIQVIGNTEWYYFNALDCDRKREISDKFFSYPLPIVIFTRDLEVFPEMLESCKKYNRTIAKSGMRTAKFINKVVTFIDEMSSPTERVHGVLMEVFGLGVLIIGESGVGKSETALDLIIRGHRLIADDAVDLKLSDSGLKGEAPPLIRYFLEIRGIGILDIERMYGVGAVKCDAAVDLVVKLEEWDNKKDYDRLGLDDDEIILLGLGVPMVVVPVKPGRNLAMIVEIAARNYRQKKLGYNAAAQLSDRVINDIKSKKNI